MRLTLSLIVVSEQDSDMILASQADDASSVTVRLQLSQASGPLVESEVSIPLIAPPVHQVSVSAQTGGTVTGGGDVSWGESATVTVDVESGYAFSGWYVNGAKVSSALEYTFTVTSDIALVAHLRVLVVEYEISVAAEIGLTVTGGGTHNAGDSVTLTAVAEDGYDFDGWFEAGSLILSSSPYTFIAARDRTLEARSSATIPPLVMTWTETFDISETVNERHYEVTVTGGLLVSPATSLIVVSYYGNGFILGPTQDNAQGGVFYLDQQGQVSWHSPQGQIVYINLFF